LPYLAVYPLYRYQYQNADSRKKKPLKIRPFPEGGGFTARNIPYFKVEKFRVFIGYSVLQ